jgi:hypothetical protein
VTKTQLAGLHANLHRGRQLQQTHEVGHRGAILAGAHRDLLLGHVELAREPFEGAGLLHRVQVGALQILDDGDLHRLLVGNLAQNCRDHLLAGQLRGPPAPLAGDQLEAAIGLRADKNRLHHAIGDDRRGQLGQLLLIHHGAGLKGVAVDLVDGNLARLAPFGLGGGGLGRGGNARQQRVQSLAQGAAFRVGGGNGHDKKSSVPACSAGRS